MIIRMLCVTIFVILFVWFLLPTVSTLFPYTTLFRSRQLPRGPASGGGAGLSVAGGIGTQGIRPQVCGPFRRLRDRRLPRSEEHTSELQSHSDLVCRLLLEKKNTPTAISIFLCLSMVQ